MSPAATKSGKKGFVGVSPQASVNPGRGGVSVPKKDIVKAVEKARKSSELVKQVAKARKVFDALGKSAALKRAGFSALTEKQIETLEAQGNTAEDWSQIFVEKGFNAKRVVGSTFVGANVLGAFKGSVDVDGVTFQTGIYQSTVSSSVVGKNALVRDVRLLNKTVVEPSAVLFNIGTLTKGKSDSFGNGLEVLIAVETGGREVPLFAELTVEDAWVLTRSRGDQKVVNGFNKAIAAYLKDASAPFNMVATGAQVTHTPRLQDVFVGSYAIINAAAQVDDVTILSAQDEQTEISYGALVKSSVLQWGSEVTTEALVDSSLLTEHSHVERHGKVTHAILGPNTGVAEGEVTSALLGPFVGFHHQSLLIAALWPEGKGNVGYGANVGSNHTGKAPDQEIWPGEGTFFGLGVNIKFPSDFTRAPYSLLASGVSMLPQRFEFPFSLVNTNAVFHDGISPAFNEVMPGWVLSDNIYMVKRNEGKYAKRNKARRSQFDFEVFRPEIVDLMLDARARLEAASGQEVYTSREIKGLGKNYTTERSRVAGIKAYTYYIQYYALNGLKRVLDAKGGKGASKVLSTKTKDARWEHERQILLAEYPDADIKSLLQTLVAYQEEICDQVQTSKEKDDNRGAKVIADYAEAHSPASEDGFVKETQAVTKQLKSEVNALIKKL